MDTIVNTRFGSLSGILGIAWRSGAAWFGRRLQRLVRQRSAPSVHYFRSYQRSRSKCGASGEATSIFPA